MSEYNTPNELNTYLCNNLEYKNIEEYFNLYSTAFTPNLDLSFVPEFLNLVNNKNKLCITHYKLIEYGVVTSNIITHIKECILKCNSDDFTITDKHYKEMYEKEYYEQENFANGRPSAKTEHRGGSNKKIIVITPFIFKLCLIRSINKKKYAMYYLLLEECFIEYNKYQIMYKDMLLSGKDTKIDNLQNDVKNLFKQNENLCKQNEEQSKKIDDLLGYAKGAKQSNEELKQSVHRLEIKIDELIKLVHQFLSNQITLIYTFEDNLDNIKFLMIYKLEHTETKELRLALRYSQLKDISTSISNLLKKTINNGFKIIGFTPIGAIQENMITVQSIYNEIEDINTMNKQTINAISNEQYDNLINLAFNVVNNNKNKLFKKNLEENEHLKSHCESMKELTKLDNEFNKEINNKLSSYLKEKIKNNGQFKQKKLKEELQSIYKRYKDN